VEGIHPQCARQQADLKRLAKLKADGAAAEAEAVPRK
jgi:hypothetical protein